MTASTGSPTGRPEDQTVDEGESQPAGQFSTNLNEEAAAGHIDP